MYLNKKQIHALYEALDAMDYRNSGEKDDDQEECYCTILDMIKSNRKEQKRRK